MTASAPMASSVSAVSLSVSPLVRLDDEALTTMLLLVLSGAERSRTGLVP